MVELSATSSVIIRHEAIDTSTFFCIQNHSFSLFPEKIK
ncbi:hypothetical protein AM1_4102 [Acaryochloris marina MBIC11017]|uniref:Uncharacterized protein n=1 Tax=Acaryochloris marina (strain MBIC 11017) TaxID=329726 RepID=B0CAL7_ACAM1|nr:hypothetical protein AM1_4102 [Acaryochloris marina MBIC11017]